MIRHSNIWCIVASLSFTALVSCDRQSTAKPETKEKAKSAPHLAHIAKLHGDITFTLEDAEALNRKYPDTFWIPPKERREHLVKDDLVKLVFNLTDGEQTQGERMWVIVKSGDSSGYSGTLDNDPYSTNKIKAGLEISFEPRHVIEIFKDEIPNSEETPTANGDKPSN